MYLCSQHTSPGHSLWILICTLQPQVVAFDARHPCTGSYSAEGTGDYSWQSNTHSLAKGQAYLLRSCFRTVRARTAAAAPRHPPPPHPLPAAPTARAASARARSVQAHPLDPRPPPQSPPQGRPRPETPRPPHATDPAPAKQRVSIACPSIALPFVIMIHEATDLSVPAPGAHGSVVGAGVEHRSRNVPVHAPHLRLVFSKLLRGAGLARFPAPLR